jgi:predicted metal-dependent peptidase
MSQEAQERYHRLSEKIASFEKGYASEQYFSMLMEDEQIRKDIEEGGSESFGFDDHEGWDQLSDEEREFIKGKIKQSIAEASNECDRTGSWGSVPSEIRKKIREMISNEVDWKKVLRSAVGSKRRANREGSIRRLHRKYPGIHPGSQRSYTSNWAVYVDQSGSVGNDDLALAFGELGSLAKKTTFDVFYFDTSVDEKNGFTWKKGQRVHPQRTRCGGTDFSAPTKHANENKHKYDGFIIITDGEAALPPPAKLRRVWVLVPGRQLLFDKPKPDVLVRMKRQNDAV